MAENTATDSSSWRNEIQRHLEDQHADGALDELSKKHKNRPGANRDFLLRHLYLLLYYDTLKPDDFQTLTGLPRERVGSAAAAIRHAAGLIRDLRRAVLLRNPKSGRPCPMLTHRISAILEDYAEQVEHLLLEIEQKPIRDALIARIVAHVKRTTGKFHDPAVVELLLAVRRKEPKDNEVNEKSDAVGAHERWRQRHHELLEQATACQRLWDSVADEPDKIS